MKNIKLRTTYTLYPSHKNKIHMQSSNHSLAKKEKLLKILFILIPFLFLSFTLHLHKTRVHGDASIYFTFIRDFLQKPFLYGYEVKHGATSPLWVMLNAIPYHLLTFEKWIAFSTSLNKLLILLSAISNLLLCTKLNKPLKKSKEQILAAWILITLYCYTQSLFISSTQLYETALATFLPALAIFLLKINSNTLPTFLIGCTTLVRPEYLLLLIITLIFISENKINLAKKSLIGISAPTIVYGYLFLMTGKLLPSPIIGRFIRSLENKDLSYTSKLLTSIQNLYSQSPGLLCALLITLILTPSIIKNLINSKPHDKVKSILLLTSLIITSIYLLFPPMDYSNRYLLTLLPILFPLTTHQLTKLLTKYSRPTIITLLIALLLALNQHIQINKPEKYKFTFDRILGNDFAKVIQNIGINENHKILIYEIQFQFSTNSKLISADGIVGGEILPYLLKQQNEINFIKQHNIDYIVVSNSFKYRKIYENTLFSQLFNFDSSHPIGSEFVYSDLTFKKVAVNPVLLNPELFNIKNGMPHYSTKDTLWKHHSLLWNSIYKIEKQKNTI